MKILSWNINNFTGKEYVGVEERRNNELRNQREVNSKKIVKEILDIAPDIVCLQEYNPGSIFGSPVNLKKFHPGNYLFDALTENNYYCEIHNACKKKCSEWSIIFFAVNLGTGCKILEVKTVQKEKTKKWAYWLEITVEKAGKVIKVLGVHVPPMNYNYDRKYVLKNDKYFNSLKIKMDFLDCIIDFANSNINENAVICGDFNSCKINDIQDYPKNFNRNNWEEIINYNTDKLNQLLKVGNKNQYWIDAWDELNKIEELQNEDRYSYEDRYGRKFRYDYIFLSPRLVDSLQTADFYVMTDLSNHYSALKIELDDSKINAK